MGIPSLAASGLQTPAVLPFQYGVFHRPGRHLTRLVRMRKNGGRSPGMFEQPESTPTSSTLALSPVPLSGPPDAFVPAPPPASSQLAGSTPSPSAPPPQRIPRWLVRTELFLRVMLRIYVGLAICVAPWIHVFWDQNSIFLQFPSLAVFATHGAVRGIVSGLGLLNLWIAFQDALRHRDG